MPIIVAIICWVVAIIFELFSVKTGAKFSVPDVLTLAGLIALAVHLIRKQGI